MVLEALWGVGVGGDVVAPEVRKSNAASSCLKLHDSAYSCWKRLPEGAIHLFVLIAAAAAVVAKG
eukprot:5958047-Alexandrium_andersonii.AAC.1